MFLPNSTYAPPAQGLRQSSCRLTTESSNLRLAVLWAYQYTFRLGQIANDVIQQPVAVDQLLQGEGFAVLQ